MINDNTSIIEGTGIMDGINAPPALHLPAISFSAPESRVATPPTVRRRRAFSQPVSPSKDDKRQLSPIGARKPLSPIAKSLLSPTRAIKKHNYHVTFSSYNPRAVKKLSACPVHSYSSIEQEIRVMPSHTVGGVKFSGVPREPPPRLSSCPVHVYQEARSSLSSLGSASFAKYEPKEMADGCPVHAYATPPSSLRGRPATFAKAVTPRTDVSSGPAVHAYSTQTSTLSARGATAFSMERLDGGRDSHMRTDRALAPVHAYAAPKSTLRSVGAATFGSSPSLRGSQSTPTLSRTGLLVCATNRVDKPRTLKPLPKLVPLTEEAKVEPAVTFAAKEAEDGGSSPREVEALQLEPPPSP